MTFKLKILALFVSLASSFSCAQESNNMFATLKNYQINSPTMMSSGLPTEAQFKAFKSLGVNKVIDLIPGDRSGEAELVNGLGLEYHNVQVVWDNPTLENFQQYVVFMSSGKEGITLTHCKLNWRGAVFTYLYRVTQLGEDESVAKQDLLAIWQPDEIWSDFIDRVLLNYR